MRDKKILLWALFFMALFLRIIFGPPSVITNDSVNYIQLAQQLSEGNFFIENYQFPGDIVYLQPLFSILMSLVNTIVNNWEISGLIINIIFSSLIVFPVFYLARHLFNERIAFMAGLLVMVHAEMIHFSGRVLTEGLFSFLWLLIIYLVFTYRNQSKRIIPFLILGGLVGLAYLTRVVGLLAFPLVFVTILFYKDSLLRKLRMISVVMVGLLIVALPYILVLHSNTGDWVLSGEQNEAFRILAYTKENNLDSFYGLSGELNSELSFSINMLPKIEEYSLFGLGYQFIKDIPYNFLFYFLLFMFNAPIILFSFLLFKKGYLQNKTNLFLLIFWIVLYLFFYSIFLVEHSFQTTAQMVRYMLPVFPLAFIIASVALYSVINPIRKFFNFDSPRTLVLLFIFAALMLNFVFIWPLSSIQLKSYPRVSIEKAVGDWIINNTGESESFLTTNRAFTYYGNRTFFFTPDVEVTVLLDYARQHNIKYIILDSWEYNSRTGLQELYRCPVDCNEYEMNIVYSYVANTSGQFINIYAIR